MKILIFSDSHGLTRHMDAVFDKHDDVEQIIFLGDCLDDWKNYAFKKPFIAVPGNCDFFYRGEKEAIVTIADKKFWLTHGHNQGVKYDYDRITDLAARRGVDVCCFGHTHVATSFTKGGILFLNPGSVSEPRGREGASYAIVEVVNGVVLAKIMFLGA